MAITSSEKKHTPVFTQCTEAVTASSQSLDVKLLRQIVLEQSRRAGVGHIGSALSVVEIIAALYGGAIQVAWPDDPDRDRFVMSKGHAALVLYAALFLRGWISSAELDSFCGEGSAFGVHPLHAVKGIDFSTGSLGHGLPIACGAALAALKQSSKRNIFVLLSDAELNEGSVWEAAMFAAHHKLGNLIVLVDANAQQALGRCEDIIAIPNLEDRWRAFGWDSQTVDGHSTQLLMERIGTCKENRVQPHVILARTVFGKGVSFMEGMLEWHYKPMSEEHYRMALQEVSSGR